MSEILLPEHVAKQIEQKKPKMILGLDEYQMEANKFIVAGSSPEERVFGLAEEVGEAMGVFKRMFRGDYDIETTRNKLFFELGDIMWYISQVANDNGWPLADVATCNIAKLQDRKDRSTLKGEGDTR